MNKKIILSTLAFGLFTSIAANAACSEETSLKIGGKVDSKLVFVATKSDYKYQTDSSGNFKNYSASPFLDTDVELKLEAKKTINDFTFGANTKLASTTINSGTTSTAAFKYANIFLEGANSGKLIFGGTPSAIDEIFIDVPQTATGGAVNGDFVGYTNGNVGYYTNAEDYYDQGTSPAKYLTNLDTPSAMLESRGTKIVYKTPDFAGFQLAVSYTFDTQANGGFGNAVSKYANAESYTWGYAREVISVAGKYEFLMSDDSKLAITLGTENGKSKDIIDATATSLSSHKDITAYVLGANLDFGPFKIGGRYVAHRKSLAPDVDYYDETGDFTSTVTDSELALFNKKGDALGLGVSYEQEGMTVAINTLQTQYQYNKFSAVSLQTQYSLAAGLVPYVEATLYKYTPGAYTFDEDSAAANYNKGSVLFIGTIVNF